MLIKLPEWRALQAHYEQIREQKMRNWFAQDPERFLRFSVRCDEILLDYSKNRITLTTLALLEKLAVAVDLQGKIRALFSAQSVNTTECRPALHVALRHQGTTPFVVNGQDVMPLVRDAQEQMRGFVERVRQGTWRGVTGKTIRDVVNIGIGGSHLGPLMATHALANLAKSDLRFHFISDVDSAAHQQIWNQIDPERTLFIVSSKSFTTTETVVNANSCYARLQEHCGASPALLKSHFVAVTAQREQAKLWGIADENIFPIWDWVGGRYSIWSAIGLPLALQIGMDEFDEFLAGAYRADQHFCTAEFTQNIPMLMGLLSVWYINFFDATTHAIIPYAHSLKHLRAYLQQLDMESNGKRITHTGVETDYSTGPIIWGELGIHGQHAFHQLLHQGTHLAPVDFLLIGPPVEKAYSSHHDLLIANALSQARALMVGREAKEFEHESSIPHASSTAEAQRLAKHKEIPGNRPSNILFMDKMSAHNLGMLLAFYEHKVFVQSVIWNVNPFDQWGVELGKTMLPPVLNDIQEAGVTHQHDSSTENLILHYKSLKMA